MQFSLLREQLSVDARIFSPLDISVSRLDENETHVKSKVKRAMQEPKLIGSIVVTLLILWLLDP